MSYNGTTKDTVAGGCPFSNNHDNAQIFYVTLPNDNSELNTFTCIGLNRTGLLCRKCQKGLVPAVLSYNWQCVECLDKQYGWLVYPTATLFPATILCLLVMVFQLHVTSAEMNTFVFLCQYITCATTILSPYSYLYICLLWLSFNSNSVIWITVFLWDLEFRLLSIFYSCVLYQQWHEYTSHTSAGVYCCCLPTFADISDLCLYWDAWQCS